MPLSSKDVGMIAFMILLVLVSSFFGASAFDLTDDASTMHYAEGYYQSYSTPYTIAISAANVYYNITNISVQSYNGISVSNNQALIARSGVYKITGTMSFSGGNSGVYEVELFTNDVGHPECTFFRDTSSNARGDATFSCIEELKKGDLLNVRVKDITTPAQSINIYAFNFNIVEIP